MVEFDFSKATVQFTSLVQELVLSEKASSWEFCKPLQELLYKVFVNG